MIPVHRHGQMSSESISLKYKARAKVYSSHKKHSTVKFLIACTALGSISFISKAWGGHVSDIDIIIKFAAGCRVELIIPSFMKGKKQLRAKEVEVSRQIASVRIHVERVIRLIKNRYKILDCVLP